MDSTEVERSSNAEEKLLVQTIPVLRMGLSAMLASLNQRGSFVSRAEMAPERKKELRPHHKDAPEAVRRGLSEHSRGKVIMACGTDKTFTALKIGNDQARPGKRMLLLVPSLALMAQTVREWTKDTTTPLRSLAVCADSQLGKRRVGKEEVA